MKAGAKGIKTLVSGRLNGVEMARSEGYSEGNEIKDLLFLNTVWRVKKRGVIGKKI